MPAFRDLTGRKFGRLTVVGRAPNNRHGKVCWNCVCEDGNETIVLGASLTSGNTRSCGCLLRESTTSRFTKHGHTAATGWKSPEYQSWQDMKDRCLNPKNKAYKYYGGRGIKVCQQWLDSFEVFLADMGLKPSPQHELDRIDPDDIYRPGNCQWATEREAAVHTRSAHHISLPDGSIVTCKQFSRELRLPAKKLGNVVRIAKRSVARGATTLDQQASKVAIQVTLWMIAADMLRDPDPPQAARDLARLVRDKDGGERR
jgi:hypothetical protein